MKWISCSDKLPEDFKDKCEHDYVFVLATNINGFAPWLAGIAQRYDGKWVIMNEEGAWDCDGEYPLTSEMITHWMHIDLPKDNDEVD